MSRAILIDQVAEGRTAAALLVDGRLEDLLIDPPPGDTMPAPGEIYRAKVDRLVPKLGAAFVKLGAGRMGFLREAKGRREGEGLLVQVVSYPEPGKASPVTARILYKGRTVIHTPDAPGVNVSRQIKGPAERARLTQIVEGWEPPEAMGAPAARARYREMHGAGGFILRTASAGASADELRREVAGLLAARGDREGLAEFRAAGPPVAIAALREWTDPPAPRIVLTPSAAQHLLQETEIARRASAEIDRAIDVVPRPDLFEHHGVWEEVERLRGPRVELPVGGWMSVEATAALVAVDVNTGGGFQGGDALTANLEAARALPRQLRLRGLGGIVTMDLAPVPKRERKRIEDALRAAFRADPVETSLAGWTPLGLFELQRKRERRPLAELVEGLPLG